MTERETGGGLRGTRDVRRRETPATDRDNLSASRAHVIFWDYDDDPEVVEAVQRELARQGVAVSAVSAILPNIPTYRARYEISPYDRHPNAMAHEMIADFVAQSLLQKIR